MKGFFCAISAFFLCILCAAPTAHAVNTNTILRVGLYYDASAVPSVTLTRAGGFSFGTVSETTFSAADSTPADSVTVTADGTRFAVKDAAGATVYTVTGDQLALRPAGGTTRLKEYTYSGDIVLRQSPAGLMTVINYVGLDDYVKGVVPYEVSASWPAEALKAQAVCARSYALGNLNKHKSYDFDLCNTTNCQVYRGLDRATAASNAAVTATAGQYLVSNGKLAVGFFFSSDGGATEDNENVWGGDPIPYLRGVKDPYEDVKAAYNGAWSVTLTADQVVAKLRAAGHSIGTVRNVQVTKRTAMDNVNAVTVTDTAGKSVTVKNSAVRTVFGLNSIRYSVSGGNTAGGTLSINGTPRWDGMLYAIGGDRTTALVNTVVGKTVLTATGRQILTATGGTSAPAGSFTFTGTGWGHNVGMSQHGALGMAKQGFSYDQILKFYFTGIEIAGS